jgi:hypothetical protein
VDVGVETYSGSGPIQAKALPVTGIVAFCDHVWNDKFASSFGYSQLSIDNSSGQGPDAFKLGQYALVNLTYTPVKNVMMGIEGGWIHRENKTEGQSVTFNLITGNTEKVDQYHVQVSAKYSFGLTLGGQ